MGVSIKLVKRLNPRVIYCVRVIREDGVEFDVFETNDEAVAQDWLAGYRSWLKQPNGAALVVIDGLLRRAIDLNEKIVACGDQQGSENYATKSHMRKWADDAVSLMDACLGAILEFKAAHHDHQNLGLPFEKNDFN